MPKIPFDPWIKEEIRRLQEQGYWFWTKEIAPTIPEAPLLKNLKDTRKTFISILVNSEPSNLIENLLNPTPPLTRQLAIKHAMIATDGSAEILDRARSYISFKQIKTLHSKIDSYETEYKIKRLGTSFTERLTNEEISGANDALLSDLLHVICFGSVTEEFLTFSSFKRFRLAEICGKPETVQNYFESLYLDVSRQLAQIRAQSGGSFLNEFVKSHLSAGFKDNTAIKWVGNRRVPGTGDKRARELGGEQFDLVYTVQPTSKSKIIYVAIEVAFQETTNSVMERKARQACSNFEIFEKNGNKLCFVIDGAGYLSGRPKALRDIIQNSHFRVALKSEELNRLSQYMIALAK